MKLPPLKIGNLVAKVPIIQGGMGVGVSLSSLASAVANEGGIGVISGVQIGFRENDFETNTLQANIRALKKEILKARELSPEGIIGINFMVAMNHYEELVLEAVKNGIDLIISGAGLPKNLPNLIKGTKTKIAPIVSSARAATLIASLWDKKSNYAPDMIVVEGPEAGGHLGFKADELLSYEEKSSSINLYEIVREVVNAIKPFEEKYKKQIPVIAAGGIFNGHDILKAFEYGASGVQMATRFIATDECDADIKYKEAFVNCKAEDIKIIKSPVGMPGRAIRNDFIKAIEQTKMQVQKCYNCIKACNPKETQYCISKALIQSVKGNINEGLLFTGSNGYKIDKIVSVKELISELINEAES